MKILKRLYKHFLKDGFLVRKGRSLDTDLRYAPVVKELRQRWNGDSVLEVGSGDYGITLYFPIKIVGADISSAFTKEKSPLIKPTIVKGTTLPFDENAFDYVVSVDMLEHIPQQEREHSIREMIRVAKKMMILAVPTGRASEEQDRLLDNLYLKNYGRRHPFLKEHVSYGLPTVAFLKEVLTTNKKVASFHIKNNVNLKVREEYMKMWMSKNTFLSKLFPRLSYLVFLSPLLNFGECYRSVVFVELN